MQTRGSFDFTTQTHAWEKCGGEQENRRAGEEEKGRTQDNNHEEQRQWDSGQTRDMMSMNSCG